MNNIEIYSSYEVLNAKKVQYKGFLINNSVKSRNFFSSIGSGLKSMVGGNIKGLNKLTADVRNQLISDLSKEAYELGANAIIGIKFETSELYEGIVDIVAYGTAVYFER